jgi:hypothetical protein
MHQEKSQKKHLADMQSTFWLLFQVWEKTDVLYTCICHYAILYTVSTVVI